MAVNKNFVVKNGVEVSTDLIYADNSIDKVGIGTTTPGAKLEVVGDIVGVGLTLSGSTTGTDANYSGIVTASSGLKVGSGGTSITVDVTNNSAGFNTTTPDTRYVLDVQAGAGQSAANFGGGVDIEGDLNVTGSFSGTIQTLNNPTITGVVTANDAEIYTQFNVINNSTSAYQYQATGIGFTQNTDNPILYLIRGKKYHFNLNASGHPFYIKTPEAGIGSVGTTLLYDDGVEGQGTQVGILTFKVPYNGPSNVYYQCSVHTGMGNTMYLLDGTGIGGGGGSTGISSITVMDDGSVVGFTTILNVTGDGVSATVNSNRIDIDIPGGSEWTGIGSPIKYTDGSFSPFTYIDEESSVTSNMVLDNTNTGPGTSYVIVATPRMVIQSGVGITLGLGKTMIVDILDLSSYN